MNLIKKWQEFFPSKLLTKELYEGQSLKLQRQLRRNCLAIDQQGQQIQEINSSLNQLIQVVQSQGVDGTQKPCHLETDDVFKLIDHLYLLQKLSYQEQDIAKKVINTMLNFFYEKAGFKPTAQEGELHNPLTCKISQVVEDSTNPDGMIKEIICQGFQRTDGSCVREAVVIVTKNNKNVMCKFQESKV